MFDAMPEVINGYWYGSWRRRRAAFVVVVVLMAMLVGASACTRDRYNVLLLTIDTLRADHLGIYGKRDIETPALDALARRGVWFSHAYSSVPLTLPSHTSILSGVFPPSSGVRVNGQVAPDEGLVTLAEVLKQRGYRTAAMTAAWVLAPEMGLNQGFDAYTPEFESVGFRLASENLMRSCDEVAKEGVAWLGEAPVSERFFLWLHFYDPHAPYEPPPPYSLLYPDRPYVGEIAFTDACTDYVLTALDQLGLTESTLVVMASDHGEGLGEHQEGTHSNFVYESTQHVPLMMALPGVIPAGGRRDETVRLVDVFSTILELVHVPDPGTSQGVSLAPLVMGESAPPELTELPAYMESVYAQLLYGWSPVYGLKRWQYAFIAAPEAGREAEELYDVSSDPRQRRNIAAERPDLADTMRAELTRFQEQHPLNESLDVEALQMDAEVVARLEALGYAAAGGGSVKAPKGSGKSPMEMARVFYLGIKAAQLSRINGKPAEAIEVYRRMLQIDPQMSSVHKEIGLLYGYLRQYDKAEQELSVYVGQNPERADGYAIRAGLRLKRPDVDGPLRARAEDDIRRALELEPENITALYNQALAYIQRRQATRALEQLRAILAEHPGYEAAQLLLVQAYAILGQAGLALQEVEKVLQQHPDSVEALFLRAQITARTDPQKALKLYQEILAQFPEQVDAHEVNSLVKDVRKAIEQNQTPQP